MGAIAGGLEPFDPEVESIVVYLERVELYFAANEIKADKRVPVFLNLTRWGNYSLLRSILSPQKPMEESVKKLMDVLREYYEPKKVVVAASFFSPAPAAAWGVCDLILGKTTNVGGAL